MAKSLTAALALMGASAAASAVPVTVSQTISLSQLLSAGGSTAITFNVNSTLAEAGRAPAGILSGDLVIYGYSDAQYGAPQTDPYGGYSTFSSNNRTVSVPYTYAYYVPGTCDSWGWSCTNGYTGYATAYYNRSVYDYSAVRSRDIENIDAVADTMRVAAGNDSATGSATEHAHVVGDYGNMTYEGTQGDVYDGFTYLYDRQRDVYDAIYGDIETTLHLDASALADLSADGIFAADVSATLGSFHLTSASLILEADTPSPSNVPEPGSLALGAIAVAGMAAARRRKK